MIGIIIELSKCETFIDKNLLYFNQQMCAVLIKLIATLASFRVLINSLRIILQRPDWKTNTADGFPIKMVQMLQSKISDEDQPRSNRCLFLINYHVFFFFI